MMPKFFLLIFILIININRYKFGTVEIFNPWSIINYLDENCLPRTYWERTGNNDIIREIVSEASDDVIEKFQALLRGESIVIKVDTSVIYPEIKVPFCFLVQIYEIILITCSQKNFSS